MKEEYEALLASQDFTEFSKAHPDHFLANAFILYNSQFAANWQFGFFDEEADKISAFIVKKEGEAFVFETQEADDAMKEPTAKLLELPLDEVKVDAQSALDAAIAFAEKEYQSDAAQSRILLLQKTAEHGLIWNATVISTAFDVINVKIDAVSKEVKAHAKHSLLDMNANRA